MAIVTVSRMYGSGGSEVAERIASSLGWSLLDNDVIDRVAERLGVTAQEVSEREERVPSLIERLTDALSLSAPELLPPVGDVSRRPSEERIIETTRRVVEEAVAQGSVVVVGRGAQAMLAEREDAVHVFCYAPRPARIERVMRRSSVDNAEAQAMVDDFDRQREQYVRRYWNRAWSDPTNYHLCVNTAWLGIDGAAAMIAALASERLG